jgi:hypothetical protein
LQKVHRHLVIIAEVVVVAIAAIVVITVGTGIVAMIGRIAVMFLLLSFVIVISRYRPSCSFLILLCSSLHVTFFVRAFYHVLCLLSYTTIHTHQRTVVSALL